MYHAPSVAVAPVTTLPVDSGDVAIDFGPSFETRLVPEDVAVTTAIAIAAAVVVEIQSKHYPVFLGAAVVPESAAHPELESRPDRSRELVGLVDHRSQEFD